MKNLKNKDTKEFNNLENKNNLGFEKLKSVKDHLKSAVAI